jgi:hypothetical protein
MQIKLEILLSPEIFEMLIFRLGEGRFRFLNSPRYAFRKVVD